MTRLEALKEIARRDGGLLRPGAVVEAARDEASPLHGAFTWDDGEAAQKYRLYEAQKLIRSFRVVWDEGGEEYEAPVFIGVSCDRTEGKEDNPYRLARDVAKVPDLVKCAEEDALGQLKAIRARYDHLKRLRAVWNAIDEAARA